jgi:hypothetical protein
MARCQRERGALLEARALYQKVEREALGPEPLEPWARAQSDARRELEALAGTIPELVVTLRGASANATLTLDGKPIDPGAQIEANPGEHRVEARDGERRVSQRVTLASGAGEQHLVLELAAFDADAGAPGGQATPPPASEGAWSTTGWLLVAGGGAALVTGGVFGVSALSARDRAKRKLPESCSGTTCPRSERDAIERRNDHTRRLGLTADVLLIGGAALAAAGAGLLLFHVDDETHVQAGIAPRAAFVRVEF